MPYASGRVIRAATKAGITEHRKQRFPCNNFIDLRGADLAPELRHPVQVAA